jgi:hypothetical protein
MKLFVERRRQRVPEWEKVNEGGGKVERRDKGKTEKRDDE